jgi:hypothetical protein
MVRAAALAVVGALLVVIAGVGSALGHSRPSAHPVATSTRTEAVGPSGSVTPTALSSSAPAGGASQLVSATVESTSSVGLTGSGRPIYYGTEPATITLQRTVGGIVVTVTPR